MAKTEFKIEEFLSFLDASPTAWHAVQEISKILLFNGFKELKESEIWSVKPGMRYFVSRNGSALCAFITPLHFPSHARIIASHLDSPALKLKPHAEYQKENMTMIGVEVYGSPLLSSWLNRDLGIAGRIFYSDRSSSIKNSLIYLDKHPLTIPQLAIHLDRNVNENGLILNKQDHLSALWGFKPNESKKSLLECALKQKIRYQKLLGFDLFLVPIEPARLIGFDQQLISAYRLDSLSSVHAAIQALLKSSNPENEMLKMTTFWDHEEVGSMTAQGVQSTFLPQILERIVLQMGGDREAFFRTISNSLCISVDLAHALHPNYIEKHDPRHQVLMNQGIVIKSHAQQRYASNAQTSAFIADLCESHHLSYQYFASRTDIPCGSTIGPLHAGLMGMNTVDIGSPQLSMHSIREVMAIKDHLTMCHLLRLCLNP